MGFLRAAGRRMGIIGELLSFFAGHKRWWMLPMIAFVLLFGVVMILAQNPAIAPFIYSLF